MGKRLQLRAVSCAFSLVFAVMVYFLKGALPLAALLAVSLVTAYLAGYGYSRILKTCRLK